MGRRLFYAVNFSREMISAIGKRQNSLRPLISRGNWSRAENFHITLHFIGPAEEEELPLFKEALEKAAEGTAPFRLVFNGYGHFRQREGDLIFLKARDRDGELAHLSRLIRESIDRGDRRELKPHVTLVRNARLPYSRLKELEKEHLSLPPVTVGRAELMESLYESGHPVYRSLHSVRLTGMKP